MCMTSTNADFHYFEFVRRNLKVPRLRHISNYFILRSSVYMETAGMFII
jgi:hypothetical protein